MCISAQLLLAFLVVFALGFALVQRTQNLVRQLRDVGMYPQQVGEAFVRPACECLKEHRRCRQWLTHLRLSIQLIEPLNPSGRRKRPGLSGFSPG
jgi:hypothetical protein